MKFASKLEVKVKEGIFSILVLPGLPGCGRSQQESGPWGFTSVRWMGPGCLHWKVETTSQLAVQSVSVFWLVSLPSCLGPILRQLMFIQELISCQHSDILVVIAAVEKEWFLPCFLLAAREVASLPLQISRLQIWGACRVGRMYSASYILHRHLSWAMIWLCVIITTYEFWINRTKTV